MHVNWLGFVNQLQPPGGAGDYVARQVFAPRVAGGASIADGDKGDVTVSASGATWTIDAGVVTFAKMQNLSANVLIGCGVTPGNPEEIACSLAGRDLISGASPDAQLSTLGGTTVGKAVFTLTNPSAVTFLRMNADNTATARTAANFRADLGLDTGDSPQFTAINLGHASDTTITRTGAGAIAVEGVGVVLSSRTISTTAPLTGGGDLSANRTLAISNFVAGGGSAAAGAVPTPGATAYPTQPQVLLSTAAWGVNYGGTVAEAAVDTSETTASTSYVGLTTACTVTVTIDVTADYVVEMGSNVGNTTAGANCLCAIDIDGTDTDLIQHDCVTANEPYQAYGARVINITAGSRVFTMQHRVGSGTGSFKWRWFRVSRKK